MRVDSSRRISTRKRPSRERWTGKRKPNFSLPILIALFELVLSRSIRIRTGYSWRNALMGSTRVARRAGMYVAERATRNMAPGTTR